MKENRALGLGLKAPRVVPRNLYSPCQLQPFSAVTAKLRKLAFCSKTRIKDRVG